MTTTEGLARDALLGIDITLPDGSTARCKALTLSASLEYLELLEKYQAGDFGALRKILKRFPKDIGVNLEDCTPGEVIDVLVRFFAARRTPASPTASGPTPTPSPSGSTT